MSQTGRPTTTMVANRASRSSHQCSPRVTPGRASRSSSVASVPTSSTPERRRPDECHQVAIDPAHGGLLV